MTFSLRLKKHMGGGTSIFDKITRDDVIFAFFPCTIFQENNMLLFQGRGFQQTGWTDKKKLEYSIARHQTLNYFYTLICKLFVVAIEKNLRMVVENPATPPHYLDMYFPVRPTITDKNRYENGDYYKKPTNYWFVGFKPLDNLVFEPLEYVDIQNINRQTAKDGKDRQVLRSMIHPQYADRFIRRYILPEKMWRTQNDTNRT